MSKVNDLSYCIFYGRILNCTFKRINIWKNRERRVGVVSYQLHLQVENYIGIMKQLGWRNNLYN